MADFGNGPYAWIKNASDDSSYVGVNIADAVSGFSVKLLVSEALESDFRHWVINFENNYDDPDFDWGEFNSCGEDMTRRLSSELKWKYRIIYEKPCEDPGHEDRRKIEVLPDI